MYKVKWKMGVKPTVTVTMTVLDFLPLINGLMQKRADIVSVTYRPHCFANWEPVEGFN